MHDSEQKIYSRRDFLVNSGLITASTILMANINQIRAQSDEPLPQASETPEIIEISPSLIRKNPTADDVEKRLKEGEILPITDMDSVLMETVHTLNIEENMVEAGKCIGFATGLVISRRFYSPLGRRHFLTKTIGTSLGVILGIEFGYILATPIARNWRQNHLKAFIAKHLAY